MTWKAAVGSVTAAAVRWAGRLAGRWTARALTHAERELLAPIFGSSLALDRVELREQLEGPLGWSGRAFVVENAIFLPLGPRAAPPSLLVHEAVHVWQFQNGGLGYIGDSLWAQCWGDAYAFEGALRGGARWEELHCEQQASLVEAMHRTGFFAHGEFRWGAEDLSATARDASEKLRAGVGARY